MIRRFPAIVPALVAAILLFNPSLCVAQYYNYYYPRAYPPAYNRSGPQPVAPMPSGRLRYYLAPDPKMIRKWESYRRWLEFQQSLRSPINPESSLDYMLRTF